MWGFGEEAQFLSAMFLTRTTVYKTRRGAGLESGSKNSLSFRPETLATL